MSDLDDAANYNEFVEQYRLGKLTDFSPGGSVTKAAVVATGLTASDIGGISAASPTLTGTPTLPTTTLFGADPISEYVQDTVAAFLVAGSGISLSYNDAANTLTIGNTGGSGGGALADLFDVRNYGSPDLTGATTSHAAIISAVNAAATAYTNTGVPQQVFLPNGKYRLDSDIVIKSGVGIRGQSETGVVLLPYGTSCGIKGLSASSGAPYTDCVFESFTIDGTNQSNGAGGYTTAIKGIFMQWLLRPRFRRVTVKNTYASGFGVDFLQDGHFIDCTGVGAGRAYPAGSTTNSGGSNFGIGTGGYDVETSIFVGCTGDNAGNHGLFFERQDNAGQSLFSKYAVVSGCSFKGNRVGYSDRGASRVLVVGSTMAKNTAEGVLIDSTSLSNAGGQHTLLSNCVITENLGDGLSILHSGPGITVRGCKINANGTAGSTGFGVRIDGTTAAVVGQGVLFANNEISANQRSGVFLGRNNAMTLLDVAFKDNDIHGNGVDTTSSYRDGISVTNATYTRLTLLRNDVQDRQATPTQQAGIAFTGTAGTVHTGLRVVDNDVRGNVTGISRGGSVTYGTDALFERNDGDGALTYAPRASTLGTTKGLYGMTAAGALVPVPAGADNQVLTADASTASGLKFAAAASGGSGGSSLLAVKSSASVYTATTTTDTDLDSTNLTATVVVPSSGQLLVRLSGLAYLAATDAGGGLWSVRDAAGVIATARKVTTTTAQLGLSQTFLITGLTPAANQVVRFGAKRSTSTLTVETPTMEVWAA